MSEILCRSELEPSGFDMSRRACKPSYNVRYWFVPCAASTALRALARADERSAICKQRRRDHYSFAVNLIPSLLSSHASPTTFHAFKHPSSRRTDVTCSLRSHRPHQQALSRFRFLNALHSPCINHHGAWMIQTKPTPPQAQEQPPPPRPARAPAPAPPPACRPLRRQRARHR